MTRPVRIVQTAGTPPWEVRALAAWRDPWSREPTDYLAGFATQGRALTYASLMGMEVEGVERAGQGSAAA